MSKGYDVVSVISDISTVGTEVDLSIGGLSGAREGGAQGEAPPVDESCS
jgi:hypothetical protein